MIFRRVTWGERGSIAPVVPLVALCLLMLGGLVIDASRLLGARGRAVAYAEEAARAGASSVRPGSALLTLDETLVQHRVDAYCTALRSDPELRGGLDECRLVALEPVGGADQRRIVVRVLVRMHIPASLLGIVGVQTLHASGEARARPFEGVAPSDVDSTPPPVVVPDAPVENPPAVTVPGPTLSPDPVSGLPCDAPGDGRPDVPPVPLCDPTASPTAVPSPVPTASGSPAPSPLATP